MGKKIDWSLYLRRLGHEPDADIARDVGCTKRAVGLVRQKMGIAANTTRPSIDWHKWGPSAGTIPDQQLADQIGCSLMAVFNHRTKMGIKPFGSGRVGPGSKVDWSHWDAAILSSATDARVAQQIGCSTETVGYRRRKLRGKHGGLQRP